MTCWFGNCLNLFLCCLEIWQVDVELNSRDEQTMVTQVHLCKKRHMHSPRDRVFDFHSQLFCFSLTVSFVRPEKNFCLSTFFVSLELKSTGTAHHFSFLLNSTDYRILRMDEDHDRMYVGSKDYILSLDLHDINKEPLIVRRVSHKQLFSMSSIQVYY